MRKPFSFSSRPSLNSDCNELRGRKQSGVRGARVCVCWCVWLTWRGYKLNRRSSALKMASRCTVKWGTVTGGGFTSPENDQVTQPVCCGRTTNDMFLYTPNVVHFSLMQAESTKIVLQHTSIIIGLFLNSFNWKNSRNSEKRPRACCYSSFWIFLNYIFVRKWW